MRRRRADGVTVGPPRSDGARLAARVATPRGETEIFFAPADGGPVSAGVDAFVPATLLPAMRLGVPLVVRAPVSPRLLAALPAVQEIFHRWNRRYRIVPVEADPRDPEPPVTRRGTACLFSCGVDSFYAVLRSFDELSALVFARPFDPKIVGTGIDEELYAHVRTAAAELGKPLVEVETNIRLAWHPWLSWEYFHGPAVASLALALAPRFETVLVPPSFRLTALMAWGSHPALDPLWSTEGVEIVHFGAEISRFERTRILAESDVALRHLQVCWQRRNDGYNCCRCEKCLRAMTTLHVLGKLERSDAFHLPLVPAEVARLRLLSQSVRVPWRDNLEALEASGGDEELVAAVRKALRPWAYRRARRALTRRLRAFPSG